MITLAIDPGQAGGFAWQHNADPVQCCPMPPTEGDVLDQLRTLSMSADKRAVIEDQVGVMGPGIPVSRSAMFTFGRGFGFLLGCLQTLGWSIERVKPQRWQKALSLGAKSSHASRTEWKQHLKAEAQRRFPDQTVTLKTADALLLLAFSRQGVNTTQP